MLIIGIQGSSPGAGKDTAYEIIQRFAAQKGLTTQRIAFGDQLKIRALRTLGFSGTDESLLAEANEYKNKGDILVHSKGMYLRGEHLKMRKYIQNYGQEMKDLVPDIWLRAVEEPRKGSNVVVYTDVRFEIEAEYVDTRQYGNVQHWYIDASKRIPEDTNRAVESWKDRKWIDHMVDNNGTAEQFEQNVERLLNDTIR